MGEGAGAEGGPDRTQGGVAVVDDRNAEPVTLVDEDATMSFPSEFDAGRRRFTAASVVATLFVAIPFLWILWGPWESPNVLRKMDVDSNYYDLQTRAMLHGHLWLANGAIGIEAF